MISQAKVLGWSPCAMSPQIPRIARIRGKVSLKPLRQGVIAMVCSMAVPTLRRSQSKEAEAMRESGEEMDLAPDLTGFVEQLYTELRRKRPQTLGSCTIYLFTTCLKISHITELDPYSILIFWSLNFMAGCRYDGTCTHWFGNDSRHLPRSHNQIHDHELAPFINKKWWTHLGKLLYLSLTSWTKNRGTHGLFSGSNFKVFFFTVVWFYLSRRGLEPRFIHKCTCIEESS